ncbi:MAG: hypothetical protein Q9Q40_07990 [Acidobacteriota bacterium]|nr:hypothetical protein [Acidobacteriota bacterium]MDQ7088783.1 hypothetical protein [Acidobacteriota bacterium]
MGISRFFLLLGLLGLGGFAAYGEAVPLPVDRPLTDSRLVLDLESCRVDVRIDPGAASHMTIEDALNGEDTEGFVLLEGGKSGLRIGRPHGDEALAPPLNVTLVLGAGESLRIDGSDLSIALSDARMELEEQQRKALAEESVLETARARRPGGVASRLLLSVSDSDLTLERISGASLVGANNRISLDDCRGPFIFDQQSTTVGVRRHWGSLHLKGENASYAVEGGEQRIAATLTGGELLLAGGGGSVQATVRDALVSVEGWAGSLRFDGADGRFDVRESATGDDTLAIRGSDHDVKVVEHGGALKLDLEAGRVEIDGVAGRVDLNGKESTTIEAANLDDVLDINLDSGSSARVRDVVRKVRARVTGSELRLRAALEVELKAGDAVIEISEISGKLRVEAGESEVDLDLEAPRARPELRLSGASSGRVTLAAPCRVRVSGEAEAAGDRVQVTGCDLEDRKSGRRPVPALRGQRPPITLLVDVGDDSRLEVWSR